MDLSNDDPALATPLDSEEYDRLPVLLGSPNDPQTESGFSWPEEKQCDTCQSQKSNYGQERASLIHLPSYSWLILVHFLVCKAEIISLLGDSKTGQGNIGQLRGGNPLSARQASRPSLANARFLCHDRCAGPDLDLGNSALLAMRDQ